METEDYGGSANCNIEAKRKETHTTTTPALYDSPVSATVHNTSLWSDMAARSVYQKPEGQSHAEGDMIPMLENRVRSKKYSTLTLHMPVLLCLWTFHFG